MIIWGTWAAKETVWSPCVFTLNPSGFTYTGGVVRELLQLTGWKFRELTVSFFRYLGVTLNNKLHWSDHTDTPHKTITDSVAALTISQRRKGRKLYLNHFRISRRSFFLPYFYSMYSKKCKDRELIKFQYSKELAIRIRGFCLLKEYCEQCCGYLGVLRHGWERWLCVMC